MKEVSVTSPSAHCMETYTFAKTKFCFSQNYTSTETAAAKKKIYLLCSLFLCPWKRFSLHSIKSFLGPVSTQRQTKPEANMQWNRIHSHWKHPLHLRIYTSIQRRKICFHYVSAKKHNWYKIRQTHPLKLTWALFQSLSHSHLPHVDSLFISEYHVWWISSQTFKISSIYMQNI